MTVRFRVTDPDPCRRWQHYSVRCTDPQSQREAVATEHSRQCESVRATDPDPCSHQWHCSVRATDPDPCRQTAVSEMTVQYKSHRPSARGGWRHCSERATDQYQHNTYAYTLCCCCGVPGADTCCCCCWPLSEEWMLSPDALWRRLPSHSAK